MRARADAARQVAAYAHRRLTAAGIDARRQPHAITVTIPTPDNTVLERWPLALHATRTHLVYAPGVSHTQIDEFIADLTAASQPPDTSNGHQPTAHWPRRWNISPRNESTR
jgi:histidine decarboxylase